ncbi:MAG TPA: FAD/NAD(P)-binding protein [Caldilineaceae bacterium]|nr:FAD/NAD(P)-binding protein [Caldilineaceae bacterium]
MTNLAIVGSGPMALYTLKHLQNSADPLTIEIFEATDQAGTGMPYRADMNADYMLCNAFSREIPPVTQTLIDWLASRPARELNAWELSWHDLSARAFYPRVLIGEYLQSEFANICELLRAAGHAVTVRTGHKVTDIVPKQQGFALHCSVNSSVNGTNKTFACDDVIIATGHSWPQTPEIDGVELISPWPYTQITELPAKPIGVLGSSLSAIDVVIALGFAHGVFDEADEEHVRWKANGESGDFTIGMVSHHGIMPEGDFYYPFPYEPLTCITEDAVLAEVAKGEEGLLERVFALLLQELDHSDPDYLQELGEGARTIAGFGDAYFARRQRLGGLPAVKRDFAEARASMRKKKTIPHHYALLRAHETFDLALRDLSEDDYAFFRKHLMPVFADCYAAVPHLSLARIIALYDAGVLTLHATGPDSTFCRLDDGSIQVSTEDGPLQIDVMIDARGQASRTLSDLPFPTLVKHLEDADAPVEEPFRLEIKGMNAGRIYCLAMPQILERFPFSQGLPNCDELTEVVVADFLGSDNE